MKKCTIIIIALVLVWDYIHYMASNTMASNNMESNNVASKTYTGHTSLMFVFEHLKHEIFDDPVELAPFVALALRLFRQLHKVFHRL